ncbi:MAG: hypothetical protein ACKOUM_09905, partial [Sphingopyxis sp.]
PARDVYRAGRYAPTAQVAPPQEGVAARPDAGLLVLTPSPTTSAQDLQKRLAGEHGPVLIILPKYITQPAADFSSPRGWVRQAGLVPVGGQSLNAFDARVRTQIGPHTARAVPVRWQDSAFTLPLPGQVQLLHGGGISPIATVDGGVLIGRVDGQAQLYVLSDPDVLNNLAMGDATRATAALRLLRAAAPAGAPVRFDVILNGLGADRRSILRTAFVPPFLGLTLCLLAATLLALWHGFVRFGPPWRQERRVALGKAGLVASSAQLIVQARRVPHFAARYGAMVREAAATRLQSPTGLTGDALDEWLDRFADARGRRFSQLLAQLESAQTQEDTVRCAAALGQWRKDILRDND